MLRNTKPGWTGILGACCALLAGFALAETTPENYIEQSDFSGILAAPTLLSPALGIGENSVQGSVSPGASPDIDYFRVQLPADAKITGIFLSISNYNGMMFSSLDLIGSGNDGKIMLLGNGVRLSMLGMTIANPDQLIFQLPDPNFATSLSFDYTLYIQVESTALPGPTLSFDSLGVLAWNAQSGTVYQAQWKDQLASPAWNDLGGAITATTDTVTLYDDIATIPQRYYRVVPVTSP
jgi:hypothetical protein